jgi:hypothetical protein
MNFLENMEIILLTSSTKSYKLSKSNHGLDGLLVVEKHSEIDSRVVLKMDFLAWVTTYILVFWKNSCCFGDLRIFNEVYPRKFTFERKSINIFELTSIKISFCLFIDQCVFKIQL